MKKKSAHEIIEELDITLIKIVGACEVYKEAKHCPKHMKVWFDSIISTAKKGLEQK